MLLSLIGILTYSSHKFVREVRWHSKYAINKTPKKKPNERKGQRIKYEHLKFECFNFWKWSPHNFCWNEFKIYQPKRRQSNRKVLLSTYFLRSCALVNNLRLLSKFVPHKYVIKVFSWLILRCHFVRSFDVYSR